MSKVIIWARVDSEHKRLAKNLARAYGVSLSEFMRMLLIRELERKNFIEARIKRLRKGTSLLNGR